MKANGFLGTAAGALNEFVPREVDKVKEEITPLQWRLAALAGQAATEIKLYESMEESHQALLERITHWLAALVERGALEPQERAEAGNTLAKLSDPRQGVINDFLFCDIPAGKFMMGSKDGEGRDNEHPQFPHEIKQEFYMTRYPITNAQFNLFVNDENGYPNDKWWTKAGLDWRKDRKKPDKRGGSFDLPNHPVVYIRWYEAAAYCNWLTEQNNVKRLTFGMKARPIPCRPGPMKFACPPKPNGNMPHAQGRIRPIPGAIILNPIMPTITKLKSARPVRWDFSLMEKTPLACVI
jgi:hypothetical protein